VIEIATGDLASYVVDRFPSCCVVRVTADVQAAGRTAVGTQLPFFHLVVTVLRTVIVSTLLPTVIDSHRLPERVHEITASSFFVWIVPAGPFGLGLHLVSEQQDFFPVVLHHSPLRSVRRYLVLCRHVVEPALC
jgi:hypothetical protein